MLVGYETSFRSKVVYLVKFNPHKFALGGQCVPLSGCWERTAEFYLGYLPARLGLNCSPPLAAGLIV